MKDLYPEIQRTLKTQQQKQPNSKVGKGGCSGLVHWDDPEGWYGEGGGFKMGNTCTPVADSCQCMAKPIQ